MSLTRSKPLKRPTETSSYIPTWDIGFSRKDHHEPRRNVLGPLCPSLGYLFQDPS
uniref:Uncharacterized protein n=1 Tax=Siphoviridae sp. ctTaQ5 TaxID=2827877 RepID=A0A8S5SR66_9CAUD|nr:MAG TPA: hypothetical protein [Siphoviridae sp. ctTaQ5]